MCIVGRSAINSKRHVHPLPSQSHSSTGARTDTRPFLDSWHDNVDTRPFFLTLVWECVSVVVHSFFLHLVHFISLPRSTLSLSLDALSLPVSPHRRHGSKPGGRDSQSAAMGCGQLLQQCGVGRPRLAAPWSGGRRGGLTGGVAGRSPAPPCRLLLLFLLHGDPAGRSVTRRRQAGGCSRRSEAAPGSLTCMRSGAAASAQQRLGRALQLRGGGGGPWPTAGRRRREESGPTRRAGRGALAGWGCEAATTRREHLWPFVAGSTAGIPPDDVARREARELATNRQER